MDAASLNLSGCVVTDNRMYGVVAQAASLSLVRCEVVRNGGVGVLVHRPGAEAVLEECVVTEHSEMGVAVQDGAQAPHARTVLTKNLFLVMQAKLDRVELLRNRHAGVYGDGPRSWLSIWRCTVDGSGVRGVGVQGGASIEVAECKIVNNAQEGIFVSGRGSRLMLRGGEVRRNGRGVVGQTKAFLMISGAEITNNTEGGVLVSDAETLVSLTGSNISHNLRGIGVQLGATAEVQGNRIEGNGAEGVYVSRAGSRALLVRNQIMGNGVKGVGVQHGAAAVMESNEVAGNALVGVHVDGQGSSAILRFNTM
ncbi:pectin lyase fold/virulence factor, partial [Baffinella frigidus]